jgi:hypothetical protein
MPRREEEPELKWSALAGGGGALFSEEIDAANYVLNWVRENQSDEIEINGPEGFTAQRSVAVKWAQFTIDHFQPVEATAKEE